MNQNAYNAVLEAWLDDADYREKVEANPKAAFAEKGFDVMADEVEVAVNTPEIVHVVFPPAPNATLPDSAMNGIVGGSIGRTTYGIYAEDGRFLGYATNTGF